METTGFEDFKITNVSKHFSFDNLSKHGKRIALIAAPVEFDTRALQGQVLIENGISTINHKQVHVEGEEEEEEEEKDFSRWNLHSETALNTRFNVLCPCSSQNGHQIALPATWNVNILLSMKLPNIKYPKIKKIPKLPKPDNLCVRWKPFGAGSPMSEKHRHRKGVDIPTENGEGEVTSTKLRKKKRKLDKNIEDESVEHEIDSSTVNKKKKKKRKEFEEEQNIDDSSNELEQKDSESLKKKKKKKKKESGKEQNKNDSSNELVQKDSESPAKKKKKKKKKESDEEQNMNNSSNELEQNDSESLKKKKKKKKKKTDEEDGGDIVAEENVHVKKKKKKHEH